nr:interleukin-4 [Jaculus jaculus]
MGLAPQLVATLLCLLVCPGNSVRGCNRVLGEIVQTLTSLLEEKTPCTEMTVAPILTDSKSASDSEALCRAAGVLRQFYQPHGAATRCLIRHQQCHLLASLRGLYRTISRLAPTRNCPVNESTQRTLKNFLENLKAIMQKKYSQCGSAMS